MSTRSAALFAAAAVLTIGLLPLGGMIAETRAAWTATVATTVEVSAGTWGILP